MTRRELDNNHVRKIFKSGDSYAITLPLELIKELGWRSNQKVEVKKWGKGLKVEDWKRGE